MHVPITSVLLISYILFICNNPKQSQQLFLIAPDGTNITNTNQCPLKTRTNTVYMLT